MKRIAQQSKGIGSRRALVESIGRDPTSPLRSCLGTMSSLHNANLEWYQHRHRGPSNHRPIDSWGKVHSYEPYGPHDAMCPYLYLLRDRHPLSPERECSVDLHARGSHRTECSGGRMTASQRTPFLSFSTSFSSERNEPENPKTSKRLLSIEYSPTKTPGRRILFFQNTKTSFDTSTSRWDVSGIMRIFAFTLSPTPSWICWAVRVGMGNTAELSRCKNFKQSGDMSCAAQLNA